MRRSGTPAIARCALNVRRNRCKAPADLGFLGVCRRSGLGSYSEGGEMLENVNGAYHAADMAATVTFSRINGVTLQTITGPASSVSLTSGTA